MRMARTDVVVAGSGDDVVVADAVHGFHDDVAAVPHHVVVDVAVLGVVGASRRIVDGRAVGVDAQAGAATTRVVAGSAAREDGVAAAVGRQTLDRRAAASQLAAAQTARRVELDGREAGALDHHLPDRRTLPPQQLTCAQV